MKEEDKSMEIQILGAAEKLFLEQGFTKTSTGQIANLVGCNQALVHYYYRTKDNLFDKIFEEKIRLVATNVLNVKSTGTTLEERITCMIEIHFEFLRQNPKLFPFLLAEVSSNPDRLQSLVDKLQQYPRSIIAQLDGDLKKAIEQGSIRPISVINLIFTILSLNLTPVLIMPIAQKALKLSDEEIKATFEERKKEVIETVLARLRV